MGSTEKTLDDMQKKLDSIQKKQKQKQKEEENTLTDEDKRKVFENATFLKHNKGNYNKLRATSKTLQSSMDREKVHIDVRGKMTDKFDDIDKVLENIEKLSEIASFDSLDLSYMGDFSGEERLILKIIGEQSTSLTRVNLSHGRITSDATGLAEALVRCTKLNSLNLSGQMNNPHHVVISALIPILSQCTALTDLNVSQNDLRGDASKSFAQYLPKWKLLTKLNLSRCGLFHREISFLKLTLPECKSLEVLNLANNKMGDIGVSYLVEVLPYCSSLRIVYLNNNYLTDTAPAAFEKMYENPENRRLKVYIGKNLLRIPPIENLDDFFV